MPRMISLLFGQSTTVRDARDNERRVYDLADRFSHADDRQRIPSQEMEEIRARLNQLQAQSGSGALALLGFLLLGGMGPVLLTSSAMGPIGGVAGLVCLAISALGILLWWYAPRVSAQEISQALLEQSRCACCAYDLRATSADPHGITQCPECGAAWELPPSEPAA